MKSSPALAVGASSSARTVTVTVPGRDLRPAGSVTVSQNHISPSASRFGAVKVGRAADASFNVTLVNCGPT